MTKPKRPRDPNQLAKMVIDIATGEAPETREDEPQRKAKVPGRKGGVARAKVLTPEERSNIASLAASARWKKS